MKKRSFGVSFALAFFSASVAGAATSYAPKISDLIGGNGAPSGTDFAVWKQMGVRFSRLDVLPYGAANKQDLINHGYLGDTTALDNQILANNTNGLPTLLMLGYGLGWNGTVLGDVYSKPVDESVWTGFVDAAVKKYSAAPYNVKYFQVWNEAAGTLSGGALQSTFWHGPGYLRNMTPESGVSATVHQCVDTKYDATANGALIQQWSCLGIPTQHYAPYPVGNNQYELRSVASGRCVEIPGASVGKLGTQLQLWDCNGDSNQLWKMQTDSTGAETFVSVADGSCMNIAGASAVNGAAVQTATCSSTAKSQKFNFKFDTVAGTAYANAMSDYVDFIHIPAAKIIRSYGGYVVYGGWPDQGGLGTFEKWLEYVSTTYNSSMLDWTDYIDMHYYGAWVMTSLYNRYVSTGKIKGVWQSEVGFGYMMDPNYITQFYFDLAVSALNSPWLDPNQLVAMIYTVWANNYAFVPLDNGVMTPVGHSLVTLNTVLSGTLSGFNFPVTYSSGASAAAIYSGNQIVFQFQAPQGAASIDVTGIAGPSSFTVKYYGGINGEDLSSDITSATWSGGHLSIKLNVPAGSYDLNNVYRNKMGYVVVTPASTWVKLAGPVSLDGSMVPSASYIIDGSNNEWMLSKGYIYKNGAQDPYSYNVATLLWYGGAVYQENTSGQFYVYKNGTWTQTTDPRVASLDGTVLPSDIASHIVDSSKNDWVLSGGSLYKNGVKDPSYNIKMILWYKGLLYQENTSGSFYLYSNGAWSSVADPRKVSASGTTVPIGLYIFDDSKNEWTYNNGSIYENGMKDTSVSNPKQLLWYQGELYLENTSGNYSLYNGSSWSPSPSPLIAAYYVSPSGSDSNTGTSSSSPFLTLEKARQEMESSTSIKTTYLMGGVYSRSATLDLGASDAGESWLGYPGQTPILDGANGVATGIMVSGASNITLRWITLRNFVSAGIGIFKVTGGTFDSNTIYNITGAALTSDGTFTPQGMGITVYGALVSSSISHNLIYNTTNHGIHLTPDTSSNATPNQDVSIDGNFVHDVNTYPGLLDTGAIYLNDRPHTESGIVISNNRVVNYGNTGTNVGARAIYLDNEASYVTIHDNVIAGNGAWFLQIHGGNNVTVYNNVIDLTLATEGVGIYQDNASIANYGMKNNVFRNNAVYMDCSTLRSLHLWYYSDSTGGQIAMLSDYSNTYYNLSSQTVDSGKVIDSSPLYKSGCVSLQSLEPSLSSAGPLAN